MGHYKRFADSRKSGSSGMRKVEHDDDEVLVTARLSMIILPHQAETG